MKTIFTLFTLICSALLFGQQWTDVASVPGSSSSKHHPVTFSIDGIGYSVAGSNSFDVSTSTSHKYDPILDQWTTMDNFPGTSRGFSYGVSDGEFGYMGFGYNTQVGTYLDDLWKFDPLSETWTELASCPCQARTHPAFIHLDGKIFVGVGGDGSNNRDDWWQYDIALNTWSAKPDFPGVPRHHPYYFDLDGYAYVGFGHGVDGIFKDFYKYDPDSEIWEEMNDFPGESRVAGTQFSHDGYGYILSGDGDDHDYLETGEFWQYNPADDSWSQLPSHPGLSRWAPGSFVIDGKAYLVQGQERFLNQFPGAAVTDGMIVFDVDLYNSPFSINENSADLTVSVFPNPFTDQLNIELNGNFIPTETTITVLDLLGKKLKEIKLTDHVINLADLAAGTYTLLVKSNEFSQSIKLVKD